MIIKNFFEKTLPCMSNKVIKYNVCETEEDFSIHYGIQIVEHDNNLHREDIIKNISPNKNFVCELITYLYENVVDTTHFKDIIEDYILSGK